MRCSGQLHGYTLLYDYGLTLAGVSNIQMITQFAKSKRITTANDKTCPLTRVCSIAQEWRETNCATMAEMEADVASTEQPCNDNECVARNAVHE